MPAWVMMLSKVKHQLSDAVPFAHGQSAFRACVLPPSLRRYGMRANSKGATKNWVQI